MRNLVGYDELLERFVDLCVGCTAELGQELEGGDELLALERGEFGDAIGAFLGGLNLLPCHVFLRVAVKATLAE
jgi:hypothetical protein